MIHDCGSALEITMTDSPREQDFVVTLLGPDVDDFFGSVAKDFIDETLETWEWVCT